MCIFVPFSWSCHSHQPPLLMINMFCARPSGLDTDTLQTWTRRSGLYTLADIGNSIDTDIHKHIQCGIVRERVDVSIVNDVAKSVTKQQLVVVVCSIGWASAGATVILILASAIRTKPTFCQYLMIDTP